MARSIAGSPAQCSRTSSCRHIHTHDLVTKIHKERSAKDQRNGVMKEDKLGDRGRENELTKRGWTVPRLPREPRDPPNTSRFEPVLKPRARIWRPKDAHTYRDLELVVALVVLADGKEGLKVGSRSSDDAKSVLLESAEVLELLDDPSHRQYV